MLDKYFHKLKLEKIQEAKRIAESEQYRLKQIEIQKIEQLVADANTHNQARIIRAYSEEFNLKSGNIEYYKWAMKKADEIDPLIKDFNSQ